MNNNYNYVSLISNNNSDWELLGILPPSIQNKHKKNINFQNTQHNKNHKKYSTISLSGNNKDHGFNSKMFLKDPNDNTYHTKTQIVDIQSYHNVCFNNT